MGYAKIDTGQENRGLIRLTNVPLLKSNPCSVVHWQGPVISDQAGLCGLKS